MSKHTKYNTFIEQPQQKRSFLKNPLAFLEGLNTEAKVIGGIGLLTLVILVGGITLLSLQQAKEASIPEGDVVSRSGIHWHPQVSISIKGKQQQIPANLGIGGVHQPVHTHDTSGQLHVEIGGVVTRDNIKLNNFFKIWGKKLSSECVVDECGGKTIMLVNGKENKEFGNYLMKDKDNIEIRYE